MRFRTTRTRAAKWQFRYIANFFLVHFLLFAKLCWGVTARTGSITSVIHNGAPGVDPDTLQTRAFTARLVTHTTPHTIVSFERWWVLSITGLTRYCPPASTTMPYRPPRRGASPRRYPRLLGQHLLFFSPAQCHEFSRPPLFFSFILAHLASFRAPPQWTRTCSPAICAMCRSHRATCCCTRCAAAGRHLAL